MTTDRLRQLLLLVFALGALGTSAELLLLEHFETWRQWLPLALLVPAMAIAVALLARAADQRLLQSLRILAIGFLAAGCLGVYFHLVGNLEFERELDPALAGLDLYRESLTGAFPALAPGAMILLGLIGLVITAGHPALRRPGP